MNPHRVATALAALVLLATGAGCSDDDPTPGTTESESGSPSPVATSSTPTASPLEGEWSASISKKSALATLRRAGHGDVAAKVIGDHLPSADFELRIAGDQLLLFTSAGEVWDEGAITIEGDQMVVEAPEVPGESVLGFEVDEATLQFSFVSQSRPEMEPGLTEEPIIRMLYTSVPWTRVS